MRGAAQAAPAAAAAAAAGEGGAGARDADPQARHAPGLTCKAAAGARAGARSSLSRRACCWREVQSGAQWHRPAA